MNRSMLTSDLITWYESCVDTSAFTPEQEKTFEHLAYCACMSAHNNSVEYSAYTYSDSEKQCLLDIMNRLQADGLNRENLPIPADTMTAEEAAAEQKKAVLCMAIVAWCVRHHFTDKQIAIVRKACSDPLKVHISTGNRKIGKMLNLALLPGFTCSVWAGCTCGKGGCYALKENRYPAVLYNRVQNTIAAILYPDLIEQALAEQIVKTGANLVRLHEAGDFVTDEYLKMILRVCSRFPSVQVYTYSKQYSRLYRFAALIMATSNLEIKVSTWISLPQKAVLLVAALIGKGFSTASLAGDEYSENACACLNQVDGRNCDSCGLCMKHSNVSFRKH